MTEETRYFITVAFCSGPRGIFCNQQGHGMSQDRPHTKAEMDEQLGPFWMILNPKSEPFSEQTIRPYRQWHPLAEYSDVWGIAYTDEGWTQYVE